MPRFNVTYQRVNESEAVHCDASAASEARGTWPSCSAPRAARYYSTESAEWETGDSVTYSIHFPDNATPASRARLCRVLARHL